MAACYPSPMDLFYMFLAGVLAGVGIVLTTHGAFEYVRIRRFLRRRGEWNRTPWIEDGAPRRSRRTR